MKTEMKKKFISNSESIFTWNNCDYGTFEEKFLLHKPNDRVCHLQTRLTSLPDHSFFYFHLCDFVFCLRPKLLYDETVGLLEMTSVLFRWWKIEIFVLGRTKEGSRM